MKKAFFYSIVFILLFTTSCNKWLEVNPDNQKTTKELFSSYTGFCDALNGCYIKLKHRDIYGEKLTMSNIESLAQLWKPFDANTNPTDYELSNFLYTNDNAKKAVSSIYAGLYNVIAQANMIIYNIDNRGKVISDTTKRSLIAGEAYAIRAFCHFDVLRLFGQLPQNASIQVSLPYAETVSATNLPKYYTYSQYVAKIEEDLNKAESLLKNNDPISKYTFSQLNGSVSNIDDFLLYRQNRFNYWAVKALQARFYLYTGNMQKAYTAAKAIIDAKGADNNALMTLSGANDIPAGYIGCPSESLMMLNVYNLMDYSPSILGIGDNLIRTSHYVVTVAQLNELFANQGTASNNRYNSSWDRNTMDASGKIYPTLKKYYYDTKATTSDGSDMYRRQIIPLIRLSEVYLIAMESTTNLSEANALWAEYMLSHAVQISGDTYNNLDAVKEGVLNEYRREFFGEGQMFFTYKRRAANSMLWRSSPITESNYIIPLPQSEFNPNK